MQLLHKTFSSGNFAELVSGTALLPLWFFMEALLHLLLSVWPGNLRFGSGRHQTCVHKTTFVNYFSQPTRAHNNLYIRSLWFFFLKSRIACLRLKGSVSQFSYSFVSRLYNPMDCSTSGLPVHHQLPEFTQTHVHWVSDAIQPSHPLSSPHQGLLKWVSSSHQVAKVLEFQLQH